MQVFNRSVHEMQSRTLCLKAMPNTAQGWKGAYVGGKLREYLAQENSRGLSWSYPSEESIHRTNAMLMCAVLYIGGIDYSP